MLNLFIRVLMMSALLVSGVVVLAQDATPAPEQEQAIQPPAVTDGNAYVRVANFASESGAVNVSLNDGSASFGVVEFQQISDWMAVPAGNYSVSLGQGEAAASAELSDVPLSVGTWTTIGVVESLEDGTIMLQPFQETYAELIPGTAGLTIVHAAEDAPVLNMVRDEVVYVSNLTPLGGPEITSIASFRIDSGTFDISFVQPEEPDTPLIDLPQTEIPENTYTLIAVVDNGEGPQSLIHTTSSADVAILTGQLEEPGTILQAAQSQENLTALADALQQAGLAEELRGEGPYTVFAPANFVLDDVAMADGEQLANMLRAHIVEGELTSREILNSETLTTLAGTDLQVSLQGDNIFVNDAQVIEVNIPATNGVIHVINGSLAPTGETTQP